MSLEWHHYGHSSRGPATSNVFASNDRNWNEQSSPLLVCLSACLLVCLWTNVGVFRRMQSASPSRGVAFPPADTSRLHLSSDHRTRPKLDVVLCALCITFPSNRFVAESRSAENLRRNPVGDMRQTDMGCFILTSFPKYTVPRPRLPEKHLFHASQKRERFRIGICRV